MTERETGRTEHNSMLENRNYAQEGGIQMPIFVVGCLLNVQPTCKCISGTDLLRQLHVPPHRVRSCRSNFLSHSVTVY